LVASQVRICAAELGLTPSARAGLRFAGGAEGGEDGKKKRLFG